jgi:hypothetical protein
VLRPKRGPKGRNREMSENQNEEIEQSAPEEEPEVEGFATNLNSSKSNIYKGVSTGLGASDFAMRPPGSSAETSIKPRHDTVKNSIGNIR